MHIGKIFPNIFKLPYVDRHSLYVEPVTVIITLTSVAISLWASGVDYDLDYDINLRDTPIEVTRYQFELDTWEGCQNNLISREVTINRDVSITYNKNADLRLTDDILNVVRGEIFDEISVYENVTLGVEDKFTAQSTSDCSMPRICSQIDKVRVGTIILSREGRKIEETAKFEVPISTKLTCVAVAEAGNVTGRDSDLDIE